MDETDRVVNGNSFGKSKEKLEMQTVKMTKSPQNQTVLQTHHKPSKSNKFVLASILALGLVLYLVDIGLHITIASKYLTMRNCSRNVKHTITDFRLDKLVDLNQVIGDLSSDITADEDGTINSETDVSEYDKENQTSVSNTNESVDLDGENSVNKVKSFQENLQNIISSKLDQLINDNIYVKLREKVFKILPEHWKQRIIDIVNFQVSRHSISSIPDICVINGQTSLTRLSQMALYICSNTLDEGSLDSPEGVAIQGAFLELVPSRSEEDVLIKHAMNGDFMFVMQDILGTNFNASTVQRINQVIEMFQNTFNETGEMKQMLGLLSNPKISANIGNLTNALGSIDPDNLDGAAGALAKIDPANMGKLEELLGQLNITLATLIIDPTVFLSFLGDPAKGKILVELQKYLPQFEPTEINDFLTIKIEIDEKVGPDAAEILGSVLSLPMSLLRKIFSLKLSDEDIEALKGVADKFLGSDDSNISSLINFVTTKWKLLTEEGRSNFARNCSMNQLSVSCRDTSIDLCPNGHLLYGTATACVLALPGIIYALSEFLHYRCFRFAEVFGNSSDRKGSISFLFSILLLPFYIVLMIPFIVVATLYHYVHAFVRLFTDRVHKINENIDNRNGSEMEIGSSGIIKTVSIETQDIDDQALQLHSIQTGSESFLQIVIQIYFMVLLVIMGGATLIAGREAEDFFNDIFPLTVLSVIVSSLSLAFTSWRLHQKELRTLKNFTPGENKVGILRTFLSFQCWFTTEIVISVMSTVALCMMTWIELFSDELLTEQVGLGVVKTNVHIIPLLILLLSIPINALLHAYYVEQRSPFSCAHGILSSIFPSRFIDYESPSRTKMFVLTNQMTWWVAHVSAWLVYGISIYVNYIEDTGFSKLLPLAIAVLAIPPFLGAIHWSSAINPLYNKVERETTLDVKKLDTVHKVLIMLWSVFTIITRVTSIGLLIFIYYEHWSEVQVVTVNLKLALIETVPYVILLALGNIGLQFACSKRSFVCGALSFLYPNGYLAKPHCAGRYIFLNSLFNVLIHILLFAVLTFYCWECTQELSLSKLMLGFPVAAILWILSLASSGIIWWVVLSPLLCNNNCSTNVVNIRNVKKSNMEVTKFGDNYIVENDHSLSTQHEDIGNEHSWNSRDSITTPM